MTLYQKVDGEWLDANMAYVNRGGVQTVVTEAYVKRAGVWVKAFTYDVIPPPPPVIEATLSERFSGGKLVARWYNVAVRAPGANNDPNIRRIRLLTTYNNAYPTSQYGGTFTAASDANYPSEPWSEWRYNGFGPHGDTSALYFKQLPRNPPSTYIIAGGVDHYLSAWTEDFAGNWSAVNQIHLQTPKNTIDNANVIYKTGRFQTTETGSGLWTSFDPGELVQQGSPYFSQGHYFYGQQITDTIGQQGAPTLMNAQIYLQRKDDNGVANANVYIAWFNYQNSGQLPAAGGSRSYHNGIKLGTLAKGQGKWFVLPAAWYPFIAGDSHTGINSVRGVVLLNKDPVKAAPFIEDYSVMSGIADNIRAGEIYVAWREAL